MLLGSMMRAHVIALTLVFLSGSAVGRDISKEFPLRSCTIMCDYIVGKDPFKAYQCECHNITTSDGFVLQAARIPAKKTNRAASHLPVFLMHGFLTTGLDWVVQPKTSDSLPYMLSDRGFDVWLGNNRGSYFSIQNDKMDINTEKFWEAIDIDQMSQVDVPAIFDYVLATTGAPKMHWVGHSQGGGQLVFGLAAKPSLKDRLATAVLLAPGVHMAHLHVPALSFLSKGHVDELWHSYGFDIPYIATHKRYFPGPAFGKIVDYFTAHTPLCRLPLLGTSLCNDIGKLIGISVGDARNIDAQTMADAYGFDPGCSSFHLLMHWAQRIRNDTLVEFDWGKEGNRQHYNGSSTPPAYDLTKIVDVKFALYDGGRDLFITPKNIDGFLHDMNHPENIIRHVTLKKYAHMDFVWGKDAHRILYPDVIDMLSKEAESGAVVV